jgi:hypothetical protein
MSKLNDVGTELLNYDAFLEARLSHSIRRTQMSDHFLFIVFCLRTSNHL